MNNELDFQKRPEYQQALSLYRKFREFNISDEWPHYDQVARALGSVLANIAEGIGNKEAGSTALRYSTAKGSLYEASAWFEIAVIEGLITGEQYELFLQCVAVLEKQIELVWANAKEQQRLKQLNSSRWR